MSSFEEFFSTLARILKTHYGCLGPRMDFPCKLEHQGEPCPFHIFQQKEGPGRVVFETGQHGLIRLVHCSSFCKGLRVAALA